MQGIGRGWVIVPCRHHDVVIAVEPAASKNAAYLSAETSDSAPAATKVLSRGSVQLAAVGAGEGQGRDRA
jgi:hypothetical protein